MSVSETEIERTKVRERCKERDIERVIMNKRGREREVKCVCVCVGQRGRGKDLLWTKTDEIHYTHT